MFSLSEPDKYLLHMSYILSIKFVYKHSDRPSPEPLATLLSLCPSYFLQTQMLSLHLHWRYLQLSRKQSLDDYQGHDFISL